MNPRFSQKTVMALRKAGWRETRRTDTAAYERKLRSFGYPIFPVVLVFLSEFGGLRVVNHFADVGRREFEFIPVPPTGDEIEIYSERVGTPLCVIGQCYNYNSIMMMDEQGRFYIGSPVNEDASEDPLRLCGKTGDEGIEYLCRERHDGQSIP